MVEQVVGAALDNAFASLDEQATDTEKIDTILSLSILNPAMGSGHFLIEVVEFIARYIVQLDLQPEDTTESTLAYWKRRVVQ
jgi:hypothetical protein